MREYIISTLVYMGCFLVSMVLGGLVAIIFAIGIRFLPDGTISSFLSLSIHPVMASVFLYIIMRIYGYKGNITYEKKSVMKILIPIIISVLVLVTIWLIMAYTPYNPYAPEGYPVEEDFSSYLLRISPQWIPQIILFILSMFFGYNSGYKKREKERRQLMSK
jgi:hypothetical protein